MSHGDRVDRLPEGFVAIGTTDSSPTAAMRHQSRPLYGLQFHPEVAHTIEGVRIIENFLRVVCGCGPTWTMKTFLDQAESAIQNQVGNGKVIAAISGGVDSSVAAVLAHRVLGKRLLCVFVDNGLLRKNEAVQVRETFKKKLNLNVKFVDAQEAFLSKLAGVRDPEKKRKIIGSMFISIFEKEAKLAKGTSFLLQGTLYPDVIESVSHQGPSAKIKTHHNVGGLPARMKLQLVEPLRFLFKDEVRTLGAEIGIPKVVLNRHPFPGPGLAVRVIGPIKAESLARLREADAIMEEEIRAARLYESIWQAFAVYLPVQSVGVMGDERTYQNAIAIRAVTSSDGMTADWARIPPEVLQSISRRITNEVEGINRVVYDISSKPPSTIEWE
jgi:GMP synthase (glutamine-hydrolysing)